MKHFLVVTDTFNIQKKIFFRVRALDRVELRCGTIHDRKSVIRRSWQ